MFQGETHQPQLLPHDAYCADKTYAQEWQTLFSDAWHCVGVRSDFPHEGDYQTLQLGEFPLLLRREGDEVHAYLNVCPHRFSLLRHDQCGHIEKLQCQYHGWEFAACGNTQKIPDARSFRPLKKGMLSLTKFTTSTCGDLIFVNLDPDQKPLASALGKPRNMIAEWFNEEWQPMMSYDVTVPANWKAYLENGIESYHIDEVHSKTLLRCPEPENCQHELADRHTLFQSTQEDPRWLFRWIDRCNHRVLGLSPHPYTHCHVYPHLTFIRISVFTYMEAVLPVGPRESRIITRGFVYRGSTPSFFKRLASRFAGSLGSRFLKEIQDEDCSILEACQRGLESETQPRGGLISTREERIFHFQRYVFDALQQQTSEERPLAVGNRDRG